MSSFRSTPPTSSSRQHRHQAESTKREPEPRSSLESFPDYSRDLPSYLVEELVLREGIQEPITSDRSSILAVECWNLRKSVLELNSQILKLKNENKTQRNLVKNLQTLVTTAQAENLTRSRENNVLKGKVTELEKKAEELGSHISTLNTNNTKQKRSISYLQQRIHDNDKISASKISSIDEMMKLLQRQLKEKEEQQEKQLREKEAAYRELEQEKFSLTSVVTHSQMRIDDLEKHNLLLQQQIVALEEKCESNQVLFHDQLDKVSQICPLTVLSLPDVDLIVLRLARSLMRN